MVGKTLESKCKVCKKLFLHTSEHVYRGCCSYTCMRKIDKAIEERQQERRGAKTVITTEAEARARIEKCEERVAHYESISENKKLGQKTRESARRCAWEWKRKLEDAQTILKTLQGESDD